MPETCRYQFDPEAWNEENDTKSTLNNVWDCPHETHPGKEFCVFHLSFEERERIGVTDEDVGDAFVGAVASEDEPNEFIGAVFGELILDDYSLKTPYENTIDMRHVTIDGRLDFSESVVPQPLRLDHSDLRGIEAQNAVFDDVTMSDIYCSDVVDFDGAIFEGNASFRLGRFEMDAGFSDVEFQGKTEFRNSVFKGVKANFRGATFEGEADFRKTRYNSVLDITRARFEGETNFSHSTFSEKAESQYTVYNGWAGFTDCTFRQNLSFRGARFNDYLEFEDSAVSGWTSFQETVFEGNASLEDTRFNKSLKVIPEKATEELVIDIKGGTVRTGTLAQPEKEGTIYYDLSSATLGNVELKKKNDGDNVFDYFQFYETNFDEFDFSKYNEDLAKKNRKIHESEIGDRALTVSGLETTYYNAKRAAENQNDKSNAAAFKMKCMRYRRKRHGQTVSESDSGGEKIMSVFYWIGNIIYDITLGFGAKPHRLIILLILVAGIVAVALGLTVDSLNLDNLEF